MSNVYLHYGDCLEILKQLGDASCDCIIDDLPYGVTNRGSKAGEWDNVIPLEPMWEQFLRVAKEDAAIILFGQGMFSARLMMSQPELYKYSLVWQKNMPSGFLNANRMPLREHEDILVFYRKQPTFHPQMKPCSPNEVIHSRGKSKIPKTNNCYGSRMEMKSIVRCEKCPTSILKFAKPHYRGQHPTEKPVELLRWLIRSYTNEADVILDATMGSGSTGVGAVMERRDFVGIEKDEYWFGIAKERIDKAKSMPRQDMLAL